MPVYFSIEQIITIFLALTSLGVTVLGWAVTGFMQIVILGIQMQERKETEARQILFTQRLEQLSDLRKWFQDGERNLRSRIISDNDLESSEELKKELIQWKRISGKAKVTAQMIDTAYPTHETVPETQYYWAVFLNMLNEKKVELPRDNILMSLVDEFYKLVAIEISSARDQQAIAILENRLNDVYAKALMKLDEITISKLTNNIPSSE